MNNKQYEYGPQIWAGLIGILFFGGCTYFLAQLSMSNEAGLILNKIIKFNAQEATMLYWSLTALSGALVVFMIFGLAQRFMGGAQVLDIQEDRFIVPKVVLQKEKTVMFSDLKSVKTQNAQGTITYTFETPVGKASLSNRLFKNKNEFQEAIDLILSRCKL